MKLHTAKVIGLNSDQRAALSYCDVLDDENAFLAILQLSCDDAFTKGRQILSELSEFYFDFEGSGSEKINATFSQVESKLGKEGTFDLLIASISGKVLYLIGQGQVDIYLKREGKLSSLFTASNQKQLISGFLNEEDRLLFSTRNLINFLGTDLSKILSLQVESFEEEISNRLTAAEFEDQGVAGLLIELQSKEEEVIGHSAAKVSSAQIMENPLKSRALKADFTLVKKFLASFWNLIPKKPSSDQYLSYDKPKFFLLRIVPKSGKGKLILALFLIFIIAIFAVYQYKTSKQKQKEKEISLLITQAQSDLDSAKIDKDSNPVSAKDKINSAKDKINQALGKDANSESAKKLKDQIEQDSASILKEFAAQELPLYLDLDLIKKSFRAEQMSLSEGKLLLMDTGTRTMAVVDLAKKGQQIIAGPDQIGEASVFSINSGLAYSYSKDKGVERIDVTNQKATNVAKSDKDLGSIKDIAGFASNVYMLDTEKNKIWKYVPVTGGNSEKQEYLAASVKPDFSNSIRMRIESSVYIMNTDGEMLRFTKGAKDSFSYSNLPSGIKNPKSFFTSSDVDNLYLLDSGNSRLLVLSKTGEFKSVYQGSRFASASDVVADEEAKKVYLLDGGKIYSMDLK